MLLIMELHKESIMVVIIPSHNLSINEYDRLICSTNTGTTRIILVETDGSTDIINNVDHNLLLDIIGNTERVTYYTKGY